jgi:hypothetical protein
MSWRAPVDLYCERTDPGLWAEPLNAVTNLGFILAGGWLLWRYRRDPRLPGVQLLGGLIIGIGLGSGAFHLVAERWAEVADVGAITLTLLAYVCLWLRGIAEVSWRWAWLGAPGFVLWSMAVGWVIPPASFNGSAGYAPPLLALLLLAGLQGHLRRPGAPLLLAAAACFTLSLGFRSVDLALCAQWPHGTHFLWHLLNALTLTLACLALAAGSRAPGLSGRN